jgi:hypothetical protein
MSNNSVSQPPDLIKDLYTLRNLWLASASNALEVAAVKDFCESVARLIRSRVNPASSITEKAQRGQV